MAALRAGAQGTTAPLARAQASLAATRKLNAPGLNSGAATLSDLPNEGKRVCNGEYETDPADIDIGMGIDGAGGSGWDHDALAPNDCPNTNGFASGFSEARRPADSVAWCVRLGAYAA